MEYVAKADSRYQSIGKVEAKQLGDSNALRLSVWLDYHRVPNTVYVSSPNLGVGHEGDEAVPGMWVVVAPSLGYMSLPADEFNEHFEELENDGLV